MHFQVTKAFTFLFAFLSILSMANPLSSSPRDNFVKNGLDARQEEGATIEGEQSSSTRIHHSHHKCANMIP